MDDKVLAKVHKFFSAYQTHNVKKNDVLIKANENPNKIFYLTSGYVKMYSVSKNGKKFDLNIFKPGSFFPMSHAINNGENLYHYQAITASKIKIAPVDKVITFIKTNPDVMFDLLQRLYRGLDGLLIKIDYAMYSDAKSRIIVELIMQAKRFGNKKNRNYEVNTSINNLATSVGLARETVSREIKKLKEKNLISIKNKKITINDLSKLADEIN